MKYRLLLISVIALIFVLSLSVPFRLTFAVGPVIVQTCTGQLVAAQVASVGCKLTGVAAGDDIVAGATGALRSGSVSGITIAGGFAGDTSCTGKISTLVLDNTGGVGGGAGAVTIGVCLGKFVTGGTYGFNGTWSGSCGGGNPCGFMTMWMYELQGSNFVYTNTSGTNGNSPGASSSTTNTISFSAPALLIGFAANNGVNSITTAGAGFTLTAGCSISGVSGSTPGCAEQNNFGNISSTNFPFSYSNGPSPWTSEGIAISGGIFTSTLTVTAWNTIDPGTPTTWIISTLFIILIPATFWGFLKAFHSKPSNLIFTTLFGLTIGGVLGTISGVELGANAIFPLGITLFFGVSLGIYVVRSRSRGAAII